RQEFAKNLFVQAIHNTVIVDDSLSELGIRVHKGIQTLLQNPLSGIGHQGKVHKTLQLRLLDQLDRALGNVHADVADAFDVLHNLQGGCDESQIACNGLLEGKNLITK